MSPVSESDGDSSIRADNKESSMANGESSISSNREGLEKEENGTDVPAVIQKKLEEPSGEPGNTEKEEVSKKNECPFMAPIPKKESPFLTSKLMEKGETKKADGIPAKEADYEADVATAKKQHEKIDELIKDRSIFNTVAKVYFKDPKTNKLENRGEGKFAIVQDSVGLYKILMVRDKVMLLGCNHYIAKSCPLVRATQVPRSWIWIALNDKSDAEVNEPKTTYFATFKTDEDFELFAKKYSEAGEANAKTASELKNKEKKEAL